MIWRTRREALVEREGAREWVDVERAPVEDGVAPGDGARGVEAGCRVAVVSLGDGEADEVGLHITAAGLARSLDVLDGLGEGERPGVLVLRVDTRGGRLAEVPFVADVIHGRAKAGYRVVAWVEGARSAGALIAMVCDEVVMMPGGVVGDAVAHVPGDGVERGGLEVASLRVGEIVSRMGGWDPAIVRAMQTVGALSFDVGTDGAVVWREDDRGEVVLSGAGGPLVLDAEGAGRAGVSIGTAGDRDELARVLGCGDGVAWVEVGDVVQRDHRVAAPLVAARAAALSDAVEAWADACERGREIDGAGPDADGVAVQWDRLDRLGALVESAPFLARYRAMGEGWLELLGDRVEGCGGERR